MHIFFRFLLEVILSQETNPQKKVKMKMQDKIEKKIEQKNLVKDPLALINLKYIIHRLAF